MSDWIKALKEWNKNKPSWCVPKKGSADYREVRAIMDRMQPMPKTRAQLKEEKRKAKVKEILEKGTRRPGKKQREVKQREIEQLKKDVGIIMNRAFTMRGNLKKKYKYLKDNNISKNDALEYMKVLDSLGYRANNDVYRKASNFIKGYAEVCSDNDEEAMRRLINNLKEIAELKVRKAEKLNNLLKQVDESGFLTSTKKSSHLPIGTLNLFPSNFKKIKKTCPNEVKELKREINKFKNNEYGWSRAIMKKVNMPLIDKVLKNLI